MIIQSEELIEYPIVSVVIPSYNRADTVGQTIDSILNQRCNFAFEIVIGDDCSTDRARDVLQEYQKQYPTKIKLLFHNSNLGLGANWAICVQHCRGKYLANCDNDDYWHNPEKLQLQVSFLESHPEYGVVHSNYRNHNRSTNVITEMIVNNYVFEKPLIKSIFAGKFQFCNATMMYRMELVKSKVNLDDYIKYQFSLQDWNTWIILSKYTDFYCLPISTATFGVETESITRPDNYEKVETRFSKEKQMYKYVCNLFPEDLSYNEKKYDIYVNGILLSLAYKKWDYKSAFKYGSTLLLLGSKGFKTKCSNNRMAFYLFCFLQKLKSLITNH